MKRKGFTLIELVVVVAIILLLAATLAPKLRKEVAKARDAKAVAALGSTRTAVNVYLADVGTVPAALYAAGTTNIVNITSGDSEYLEQNVVNYVDEFSPANTDDFMVPIGGHKTTAGTGGTLSYGGRVEIVLGTAADEMEVVFDDVFAGTTGTTAGGDYDTKGNAWASY